MDIDLKYFKSKLEDKKRAIENDLGAIAQRNPSNPGDWQPKFDEDINRQAPDEIADKFEEMGNTVAIEAQLQDHILKINAALERMENGSYGICTECGKELPVERLEADPSASTCANH